MARWISGSSSEFSIKNHKNNLQQKGLFSSRRNPVFQIPSFQFERFVVNTRLMSGPWIISIPHLPPGAFTKTPLPSCHPEETRRRHQAELRDPHRSARLITWPSWLLGEISSVSAVHLPPYYLAWQWGEQRTRVVGGDGHPHRLLLKSKLMLQRSSANSMLFFSTVGISNRILSITLEKKKKKTWRNALV